MGIDQSRHQHTAPSIDQLRVAGNRNRFGFRNLVFFDQHAHPERELFVLAVEDVCVSDEDRAL